MLAISLISEEIILLNRSVAVTKIRNIIKHIPFAKTIRNKAIKANTYFKKRKIIDNIINDCENKQPPYFTSIEIETINKCNGVCEFCPVNKNADTRKYHKMDANLFYSIINQLKEIDYDGRVALFSNNEPFLDNRIEEFAKFTRENLPKAYIYLNTNATLLTLDRFKEIISFINGITIGNYNADLVLNETTKTIMDYCKSNTAAEKKVKVFIVNPKAVRLTRGGQSPNNNKKEILPISCILPWKQLVIRPTGEISLCCQDALGKYTLGDLNHQSIKEIWHSESYKKIRQSIREGRKNIDLCKYCDYVTTDK